MSVVNKVDMGLDDIIRLNRKTDRANATGNRRRVVLTGGRKKQNSATKFSRDGPRVTAGRKVARPAARQIAARRQVASAATLGGNNKKVIQNLVKKAVKKALLGSQARSPAVARRVPASGILSRLSGVSQKSRVISRARPVVQKVVRGRVAAVRRQPRPATQIVERIIERPVIRQQQPRQRMVVQPQPRQRVIVAQQQQPRRQRVIQRQRVVSVPQTQNIVVQRVQQLRQQGRPQARRQRIAQMVERTVQEMAGTQGRPRTVYVERREVPMVQNRVIRRPVQVVERIVRQPRVQMVRQAQPRVQYVEVQQTRRNPPPQRTRFPPSGIVTVPTRPNRNRQQQSDRFESSSSFLDRTVVRKGRGFNNRY